MTKQELDAKFPPPPTTSPDQMTDRERLWAAAHTMAELLNELQPEDVPGLMDGPIDELHTVISAAEALLP